MLGPQVTYLRIMIDGTFARAHNDQRGVSAIEWVVISAMLILIAGIVYGSLKGKIEAKADGIDMDHGLD